MRVEERRKKRRIGNERLWLTEASRARENRKLLPHSGFGLKALLLHPPLVVRKQSRNGCSPCHLFPADSPGQVGSFWAEGQKGPDLVPRAALSSVPSTFPFGKATWKCDVYHEEWAAPTSVVLWRARPKRASTTNQSVEPNGGTRRHVSVRIRLRFSFHFRRYLIWSLWVLPGDESLSRLTSCELGTGRSPSINISWRSVESRPNLFVQIGEMMTSMSFSLLPFRFSFLALLFSYSESFSSSSSLSLCRQLLVFNYLFLFSYHFYLCIAWSALNKGFRSLFYSLHILFCTRGRGIWRVN